MKTVTLDNGIILHLDKLGNVGTVGICVIVGIGSVHENEEERGISHLLEHMMFKSNEKYSYRQIANTLELNGGKSNAYTSTIATAYFFETLPRGFEKVLDVVTSMFLNARFREDEFENEKKVVLSEIERCLNDPESRLVEISSRALYGKSDYGDPIGGYRETVESLEKSQVEEFKHKFYVGSNIFVLLSGNFSERHATLVEKAFGKVEEGEVEKKRPEKKTGRDILIQMPTKNQIYYSKNFHVAKADLHVLYALEEFSTPGFSSPLFQIFREKYGIGYRNFFGILRSFSAREAMLSLMIPGFEKDKEGVLEKAEEEFFHFLSEKIEKKFYEGRKRRLKLEYEKRRVNVFERMQCSCLPLLFFGETYDEFMRKVFKVDEASLTGVVKKLRRPKKAIIEPSS